MPEPAGEKSASAGISDLTELTERLKEELGRAPGASDGGDARAAWRHQAERLWCVSADRPIQRRPGLKGKLFHPPKVVLRKLMRWYVEPLAAEQRAFNDAVLKLLDDVEERLRRLEERP